MERHELVLREKLIHVVERLHAFCLNSRIGNENVKSLNVHSETFGNTGHIASHLTESVDAERLALKFRTGRSVELVAADHNHHTENETGHSVGVLTGSVHHTNVVFGSGFEVDVVIACA